eukprot:jgi/Bigna1/125362/aug1.1_g70
MSCDISTWSVGAAVTTQMNVGSRTMSDGSSAISITTDMPSSNRYFPNYQYSITVSTTAILSQKVVVSAGSINGQVCVNRNVQRHSHTYTWTAPAAGSGTVSFHILAGNLDVVYVLPSTTTFTELTSTAPTSTFNPTSSPIVISHSPSAAPSISASPTTLSNNHNACFDSTLNTYQCSFTDKGLTILWSYSNSEIAFNVSKSTDGWVSLGFGKEMVGAVAVIGWCIGGSHFIQDYKLNSKQSSGVNPVSTVLRDLACSEINGVTSIKYIQPISSNDLTIDLTTFQRVIYAWGTSDSKSKHDDDDQGRAEINFKTGEAKLIDDEDHALGHGICMWIAFSFLLVSGILVSRYALIFASAGLGIAFVHFDEPLESSHGQLGLVICIALICQILAGGFLRPDKSVPKSKKRFMWEIGHKGVGSAIVVMALVNVFTGLLLEGEGDEGGEHSLFLGLHVGWILFIVVTICIFEFLFRGRLKSDETLDDLGDQMHQEMDDRKIVTNDDIGSKGGTSIIASGEPQVEAIGGSIVINQNGDRVAHV